MTSNDNYFDLIMKPCKDYIMLNKNGYIEFKGNLKDDVRSGKIKNDVALLFILQLMKDILMKDIKNYSDYEILEKELYNSGRLSEYSFRENYDNEIEVVKRFLNNSFSTKNQNAIDSNNQLFNRVIRKRGSNNNFNTENHNRVSLSNQSDFNNEKICLSNDFHVVDKKDIINSLKKFDKNSLCFILDLNPSLTSSKQGALRNQLADEMIKLNIKPYFSGAEDLKEMLYEKQFGKISLENNGDIQTKSDKEIEILSKITKFNNESLENILKLKKDFSEIYKDIDKNNIEDFEIKTFCSLYENSILIRNILRLNEDLKSYSDKFIELKEILHNGEYVSLKRRKLLIDNFQAYYDLINKKLYQYPIHLINKFLDENIILKDFLTLFKDLNKYDSISSLEDNAIEVINSNLLKEEVNKYESFFENIDGKKIDDVVKMMAITSEIKNTRVIAGAGTGKTFTIQSKVKFLIEHKNVSPDKILCLCYTGKGANDLDRRVNKLLDESNQVEVCTFHEFCRRVDRYCGGNKTTNRYLLDKVIHNYVLNIIDDANKFNTFIEYFSYYSFPLVDKKEFNTLKELEEFETGRNLVTLKDKYTIQGHEKYTFNGEKVKSLEELIIANYLFMHNIEYEYEKPYPFNYFYNIAESFLYSGVYFSIGDIANKPKNDIIENFIEYEKARKRYRPDFYLVDYDIYLEHFGLDRNMHASWLDEKEAKEYEELRESKIFWHGMYGTKLIETFSYFMTEEKLLQKLEAILRKNKVKIGSKDKDEIINILMNNSISDDYNNFKSLVKSFINIFEAKSLSKSKFIQFKKENDKIKDVYTHKRQELFLKIVKDIYGQYYELNLGEDIDHNREVTNALELIESGQYDKKYDYILIDEYQDINFIRCKLLQELQKSSDANIFAVGDDWQAIYRFNGSDMTLFTNFEKYFPNSETFKIQKTYRNSKIINQITRDFILKNKNQEEKSLVYYEDSNSISDPIKIVYYPMNFTNWRVKANKIQTVHAIIKDIIKNYKNKLPKILLLGRTNKDIDFLVGNRLFKKIKKGKHNKIIYSNNKNLDIKFMTIHQSKGLECDEVIILNFENKINGFPNQIEDDPILKFVKSNEKCRFAEERRLLYVALTRTKNNVYLLAPESNYSEFITELIKDFNVPEKYFNIDYPSWSLFEDNDFFKRRENHDSNVKCPKCGQGYIRIVHDNYRDTKYVRCSNDCGYNGGPYYGSLDDIKYIEPCPSCRGILIRNADILKCCLNYHEGCMETKELQLDEEDLEYEE